jgi:YidC/Oxa1 family membrane protein insertase
MDKRTIIAISLSLVVWFIFMKYFMPEQKPAPVQKQQVEQKNEPVKGIPAGTVKAESVSKVVSDSKQENINIKTSYYDAVLTNKGARIESIKYGKRAIELAGVEVHGAKGHLDFPVFFSEKEFLTGNSLQDSVWNVKKISDSSIKYSITAHISGNPVTIEKTYAFNEKNPSFDLTYKIINQGRTALSFADNSVIISTGDSLGPKMDDYDSSYNQVFGIYYSDGSLEKGERGGGIFSTETDTKKAKNNSQWYGQISRYFALVMIPQNTKPFPVIWDSRSKGGYRTGGIINADSLAPKASFEKKFRIALAEKEKAVLASVDPEISAATDVSKWIEPLRDGIFFCLLWINKLFGNFGLSIIVLSFITKFLFLPLTIKSTNSMKRMSELQPKLVELKEKYQDNPQKLQKATMELYKVNKVNPMGGCLPILIQMPFFIALYSALSTSFGLWQAPFVFWIKDLSAPDTLFTISGFNMNILPLIMTASTYIQQKMTQMDTAATGSQKMIMKFMPLMFIFIFWSMPSGLTLYWTVQNVLQIAHQTYVNKRKNGKKATAN